MGHFLFFLFAVVAGLFWTAACTAVAARVTRGWLKALLAAIGAGLPVIALLPVVAAAWWLAFGMRIQSNWFPQAITVLLSLVIGGAWIVRTEEIGYFGSAERAWYESIERGGSARKTLRSVHS